MLVTKEFKTIEEQIVGLEKRNLKFKNREKAKAILARYNYFDIINGFESILIKKNMSNKMYENVCFEDFYDLYIFDMKLKQVTLSQIFDIESRLRTSIAHNFTSVYCRDKNDTMRYTDSNCYKMPDKEDKHMMNVFKSFDLFRKTLYMQNGDVKRKSFIDELKDSRNYVREYIYPPFWVVIKALPLGSLYYTFVFWMIL